MTKQRASSGSPYEDSIGFCRAVRTGNRIVVAGTGPIAADGSTAAPGDAYGQAKRCFEIIAAAIANLGGDMKDVVRTRMFLVNVEDWEKAGRAHGEAFAGIKPAATMVAVKALIGSDWLIEIEAEAEVEEQ
jgi:enamine deaminase RidA (YjgF/YER057c/UK114 family)